MEALYMVTIYTVL